MSEGWRSAVWYADDYDSLLQRLICWTSGAPNRESLSDDRPLNTNVEACAIPPSNKALHTTPVNVAKIDDYNHLSRVESSVQGRGARVSLGVRPLRGPTKNWGDPRLFGRCRARICAACSRCAVGLGVVRATGATFRLTSPTGTDWLVLEGSASAIQRSRPAVLGTSRSRRSPCRLRANKSLERTLANVAKIRD